MSNVRCLDGDQNIAECEAELVSLDCQGENIWLHCSNKTGDKVHNSRKIVTISLATTETNWFLFLNNNKMTPKPCTYQIQDLEQPT